MSHQQLLILIELDAFDDRLLDPQQGLAIRWRSARRSPLTRFLFLDSPETYAENGVFNSQPR